LAARMPALTRSWISSRSNCATAARMCMRSLLAGTVGRVCVELSVYLHAQSEKEWAQIPTWNLTLNGAPKFLLERSVSLYPQSEGKEVAATTCISKLIMHGLQQPPQRRWARLTGIRFVGYGGGYCCCGS
jgi:hypothetical protein